MILLRHGQSEFNAAFTLTKVDPGLHDPCLTALGQGQAQAAAEALRGRGLRRIVVSPYTRALQTAEVVAASLSLPVLVETLVRERCAFACDVGTPRTALAAAWPQHDFAAIDERWWPVGDEDEASVVERAGRFRNAMAPRPDWADTLVVSHWGFILALSGHKLGNGEWLRYDPTGAPPARIDWRHG